VEEGKREVDGVIYLTTEKVKADSEFGWSRDSLYRLKRAGVIQPYHFFGDTHTYWQVDELRKAKTRPFKAGELSPKENRQQVAKQALAV